jgi:predicted nucleotidyltransferase component of viral defense system
MTSEDTGLAASIHQRLLNLSKARSLDFNLLLTRFAIERFLYRLSQSPYADVFVLKGAMLLQVWLADTSRPTRDLDLLGFGDVSAERLRAIFAAVSAQPAAADGCQFHADSVTIAAIRAEDEYGGQRVTLSGHLGNARLRIQVDIGIGDRVTPPTEWIEYPTLLDFPRPRLRAYRAETTIAEKLHAMVVLDLQNSRMKDFFDIWRLAQTHSFSGRLLTAAVQDTFDRRRTAIPVSLPTALTPAFAQNPTKARQWQAFLKKNNLSHDAKDFGSVIGLLARFLGPVLQAAHVGASFSIEWPPEGPWTTERDGEPQQEKPGHHDG